VKTLNERYSPLSASRRYEVWFIRVGLSNSGGAWWFRYLLLNPGRGGCRQNSCGKSVQVWATWFPREGTPQRFIQGFSLEALDLSAQGDSSFHFRVAGNEIGQDFCRGILEADGHTLAWNLRYRSTFHVALSNKGWIGFSQTPHSDACFSGEIRLDGQTFEGDPVGFGLQGHNCGYRHRSFWTWAHAYFTRPEGPPSTLEALVYDMPMGLVFRRAILWHGGQWLDLRGLKEIQVNPSEFAWRWNGCANNGLQLDAAFDGNGPSLLRLPYLKTDCSGSFEVLNNSLANSAARLTWPNGQVEELQTSGGAVLEMGGRRR